MLKSLVFLDFALFWKMYSLFGSLLVEYPVLAALSHSRKLLWLTVVSGTII